jgi:hypothetical protein
MSEESDLERFGGTAESVRPLGRRLKSENLTSAEDRKAQEAARKALEEDDE